MIVFRAVGRRRLCACVFLMLTTLNTGCSMVFVRSPSLDAPGRPTCTTSEVAPTVDVVLATLALMGTLVALSRTDADYSGKTLSRNEDILVSASLTMLPTVSAIYGYSSVNECREIMRTRSTALAPSGSPLLKP
jgi:hypothetical protein